MKREYLLNPLSPLFLKNVLKSLRTFIEKAPFLTCLSLLSGLSCTPRVDQSTSTRSNESEKKRLDNPIRLIESRCLSLNVEASTLIEKVENWEQLQSKLADEMVKSCLTPAQESDSSVQSEQRTASILLLIAVDKKTKLFDLLPPQAWTSSFGITSGVRVFRDFAFFPNGVSCETEMADGVFRNCLLPKKFRKSLQSLADDGVNYSYRSSPDKDGIDRIIMSDAKAGLSTAVYIDKENGEYQTSVRRYDEGNAVVIKKVKGNIHGSDRSEFNRRFPRQAWRTPDFPLRCLSNLTPSGIPRLQT